MAKAIAAWLVLLAARGALGVRMDLGGEELEGAAGRSRSNITACAAVSQKLLRAHARCSASLGQPATLERFPNLHRDWCDQKFQEIAYHHCESEEKDSDRMRTASLLERSFHRVTDLVGSAEEELTAVGAWEDCSGALHSSSCTECQSRHAGAREYLPTTHACEWRAGACVRSRRARPMPFGRAAEACGEDPRTVSGYLELGQGVAGNRSAGGRKKLAFLMSVTYEGDLRLPGTYSDSKRAFGLLTKKKGFHPSNIFVLYDKGKARDFVDQASGLSAQILPGQRPFRKNGARETWDGTAPSFWEMINWVLGASGFTTGDHFFFHFSGHGAQSSPTNTMPGFLNRAYVAPDELDGKDEFLAMANGGAVMDNDFYELLTRFPQGSTVTAMVDACHSEGFSDLPFNYMPGRAATVGHFEVAREWCTDIVSAPPVLPRARITYISGSQNEQTSADLGAKMGGALSNYLMTEWAEKTDVEVERWNVRHRIEAALGLADNANGGGGWERGSENSLFNRFKAMRKYFKTRFTQEPNVCAFPSIPDMIDFDPFEPPEAPYGDPEYDIGFHPFVGGARPPSAGMTVPPLCDHGGRGKRARAIMKNPEAAGFVIVDELKSAAEPYKQGGAVEGWNRPLAVGLTPSGGPGVKLSSWTPDVVSYVAPGSAGATAGLRPGDVIASRNGQAFAAYGDKEQLLATGGRFTVFGTRS